MKKNRVLLVDGMALLFRGYFANAYGGYIRKTSKGLPTNGIYGFMKIFADAIRTFEPSHVVCCWDLGGETFRTEQYAGYKANRPEPPDTLLPQFDLIKKVVEAFDVPNVSCTGYEADDCIGTLAKQYEREMEVYILTGDHDLLQLVSEKTKVVIMRKGASNYGVYDPDVLFAEKQLTAKQFIDLKGLIGDTSDNYPGVKGVGEKTAVKLLLEYGTIDGILENLEFITKSVRTKIENDVDMLQLCRKLAAIQCDAPVECDLTAALWNPSVEKVQEMFIELELKSLMKELQPHLTTAS